MPTLYLVRHGRATAGFGEESDPGLDELGRAQSQAAAQQLAHRYRPMALFTSPLRRCRETAAPLEKIWGRQAALLPAVAEIPSPSHEPQERGAWLRSLMGGSWNEAIAATQAPDLRAWRDTLITALLDIGQDAVIFSHFIAINVAAGKALEDERMVCFRPDNASINIFTHDGVRLKVIEQGQEAITQIR